MKKIVLLYSGGMDSLIAYRWYHEPETLYVNLGTRYAGAEIEAVKKTLPDTTIINIPEMGRFELDNAHFPGRNSLLAWCGASVGGVRIILVTQKGEMTGTKDRTNAFFKQISHHLSYVFEREIIVETPFANIDKTEMVEWYLKSGGELDLLYKTIGCYRGAQRPCGNCSACLRRYVAFMNNGLDPQFQLSQEIKIIYRKKLHTYPIYRQKRMLRWLT